MHVSSKKLLVLLCLLLLLPAIMGIGSYWISALADRKINPYVDPEYRIAVESQVSEQQKNVSEARDYMRNHIDVLGRRLGSLQAQISRIEAVEQRVAKEAGVDLADFQFGQDPAVGGANVADTALQQSEVENTIIDIEQNLALRENELKAIDHFMSNQQQKREQTPAGWPIKGGWVSSKYGKRAHPLTGRKHFHQGVDIPSHEGKKVYAVASGVVVRSDKNAGYGWVIEINHGDGYQTLYGHNRVNLVSVGDAVVRGQVIAEVGSTGISTGPHVHFEVTKNKQRINPLKYLQRKI